MTLGRDPALPLGAAAHRAALGACSRCVLYLAMPGLRLHGRDHDRERLPPGRRSWRSSRWRWRSSGRRSCGSCWRSGRSCSRPLHGCRGSCFLLVLADGDRAVAPVRRGCGRTRRAPARVARLAPAELLAHARRARARGAGLRRLTRSARGARSGAALGVYQAVSSAHYSLRPGCTGSPTTSASCPSRSGCSR